MRKYSEFGGRHEVLSVFMGKRRRLRLLIDSPLFCDDLCEAARIDGMSEYRIYASIMLPLSKPALSTLTIFTFVATWNDYLGPLIYLKSQEKKTIQLGLKMFISQYSSDYGLIMAGSVLSLIPVLIVFLVLQKYFVEGVASTGLKG